MNRNSNIMNQKTGRAEWLVIAVVASFAVIPMCIYGGGPEWARWDAAQAMQHFHRGETDEAIFQLRSAVERSPRDPVVKLLLADALAQAGDADAGIALADEVLEKYPSNRNALQTKSSCQRYGGDFVGALQTHQQYRDSNGLLSSQLSDLNELAYYRALAKKDIQLANQDIEEAVQTIDQSRWECGDLTLLQKTLVACVLIGRDSQDMAELMQELDYHIEKLDLLAGSRARDLVEHVYENIQQQPTFDEAIGDPTRERRFELQTYQQRLAVLLTVRALVHQDRDETGLCQNDRQHIRELGLDADEIASELPDDEECLYTLNMASAYLDTRGLVRSLVMWVESEDELLQLPPKRQIRYSTYERARDDLSVSVLATKAFLHSLDGPLHNKMESAVDPIEAKEFWREQTATMLYHRMTLYQRRGETDLAEADRSEIISLGFQADDSLF